MATTLNIKLITKRLVLVFIFTSIWCCNNEPVDFFGKTQKDEPIKLLKKITLPDGKSIIFTYNPNGTLKSYSYFLPNDNQSIFSTNITYENGLPKFTQSFNQNNQLEFEEEYLYSNDKLVQINGINYVPDINLKNDPIIIKLDYINDQITKVNYDGAGVIYEETYSYDEKGNIQTSVRSWFSENNTLLASEQTDFTYDTKHSYSKSINPVVIHSKFADFKIETNINNVSNSIKKHLNGGLSDIEIMANYIYNEDNYPIEKNEITPWGNRQYKYEYAD
ncbi:hypothetical protein [Seonamhaeicola marinus]|uniref:Uncharacterized protein n=1 Tax=Seonamhaeicola marinus TaxID=1912246 RepID=A0A5D0HVY3_9FLAO|nr:hypothetical protein [Seonamhaeicola marinus]TYA74277.1 hypothetical protein FUA24_13175 [Seonamhaeicola marinus]